jgi:RNA polymerase subunit RPABC4/transcription elongation factor Spt4
MVESRYNFNRNTPKNDQPKVKTNKFGHTVLGQLKEEVEVERDNTIEIIKTADLIRGLQCDIQTTDDILPKILQGMLDSEELKDLEDDHPRRKQVLDQFKGIGCEPPLKIKKEEVQHKMVNISDLADNDFLLKSIANITDDSEEEIIEEEKIEENSKKCSNCKVNISNTAKFCTECGASQEKKFCTECGFVFIGLEKFCPECGTKK